MLSDIKRYQTNLYVYQGFSYKHQTNSQDKFKIERLP